MKALFILNDGPYGSERSYNGLRLALALGTRPGTEVRVFLIGDAVGCAIRGQTTPNGYYNIERMIAGIARRGGVVGCCGSCRDARGLTADLDAAGSRRSSMEELSEWMLWADKVVTF